MNFNNSIIYAIEELIQSANFQIYNISYDEEHFGNAEVSLTSSRKLKVRYLLDRGEKWCELGRLDDEWFSLSDVLDVLGIKYSPIETEFVDWVNELSKFIKKHLDEFEKAFDDKNYVATQKQLKELARQRMLKWLKP